ncbi:YhjD/YihY/BrkB family envelope integrity protein [Streptomyces sp. NPDC004284]|uniref:YhjD/YihY/BrkB family envelope integrity protein n=1 Tax=Streptomyces sp. NPDC004284 TaxID=3364695 RepID=UPI00367CB442
MRPPSPTEASRRGRRRDGRREDARQPRRSRARKRTATTRYALLDRYAVRPPRPVRGAPSTDPRRADLTSVIFRRSPRRAQPGCTWLAFGATVHLVPWLDATWALSLYVGSVGSFTTVYGPLSAFVALLLWGRTAPPSRCSWASRSPPGWRSYEWGAAPITEDPGV